jgi:hypothetical protein
LSNGDRIFVRLHGTTMFDDDRRPRSASGHWSFTGGTGKMKGITGKGTYTGKAGPDGSMTYAVEGEYRLPPDSAPPAPTVPPPLPSPPPAGDASPTRSSAGRETPAQPFGGAPGSTFAPQ